MAQKIIYFDYAAATPVDDEVIGAMMPYFSDKFFNPSGLSLQSREVSNEIAVAKKAIAATIGATEGEVVFTAGGTEANNLAIQGIMNKYPAAKILTSAVEHDSVLLPSSHYLHGRLPVNQKGRVIISEASKMINDGVVLISCIYASNEVGTIQPLRDLSSLVADVRRQRRERGVTLPLFLHTDACQAASHLDIHVARLGVDLMTVNGGKLYGPKQSGFLYVKTGVELQPIIDGGGQEAGLRAGTQNVPGIIGLSIALVKARRLAHKEKDRLGQLQIYFESELLRTFPDTIIHGDRNHRLPHHLSVAFPGVDNERLLMMLDEKHIVVALGSACHASRGVPSSVLRALGVSDELAASTIRWTMGRETSKADIDTVVKILERLLPEAKRLS